MRVYRGTLVYLLFIIWLASILLVNPSGDFPFGDDFAYAGPIKKYLDTGNLKITDWSSMTLVGHLWIGIFVSKIFGFSFEVLRMISLVFGLAGGIASYKIFRILGLSELKSFFAAILIIFNATYYLIAFSFHTDITFFGVFSSAFLFYLLFLQNSRPIHLVIAVVLNIYAFLIRDLALILPFAFAASYIHRKGLKKKQIIIAVITISALVTAYLLHRYWLVNYHGLPHNMDFCKNKMIGIILSNPLKLIFTLAKNFYYCIVYYGFSFLPITVFLLLSKNSYLRINKYLLFFLILIFSSITVGILHYIPKAFNQCEVLLAGNIKFHNFCYTDVDNPSAEFIFSFNRNIIYIFTILGFLSGLYLLSAVFQIIKEKFRINKKSVLKSISSNNLFSCLFILLYFIPIMTQVPSTRYYLPPMIVILVIIFQILRPLNKINTISKLATSAIALIFFYYSLSGAHDMLEYNRTVNKALTFLNNEMNIPPDRIDGGFEYNAWHFYDYNFRSRQGRNWWWVHDNQYRVLCGKSENYSVIKEYNYHRWMPFYFESKIFVLKKRIPSD